jgi:hypothetical protein
MLLLQIKVRSFESSILLFLCIQWTSTGAVGTLRVLTGKLADVGSPFLAIKSALRNPDERPRLTT